MMENVNSSSRSRMATTTSSTTAAIVAEATNTTASALKMFVETTAATDDDDDNNNSTRTTPVAAVAVAAAAAAVGAFGDSSDSGRNTNNDRSSKDLATSGAVEQEETCVVTKTAHPAAPIHKITPPLGDGDDDNDSNNDASCDDETMSSAADEEAETEATRSPSHGAASSEEESVAEMDYMSEGSNLSLKGLRPATAASFLGGETNDNTLDEATLAAAAAAAANFVVPSVSQLLMNKHQGVVSAAAAAVAGATQDDASHNSISSSNLSSFRRYHASGSVSANASGESSRGAVNVGGNNKQTAALTSLSSSFRNYTNAATATGGSPSANNNNNNNNSLRLGKKGRASLLASIGGGSRGEGSARTENNNALGTRFLASVAAASSTSIFSSGGGGVGIRNSLGAETSNQPLGSFDTLGDHHRKLSSSNSAGETFESEHRPLCLPKFRNTTMCMWTASHAANYPTEDRSASLVNLLLQPLPPGFDSETQLPPLEPDYKTLIRLNLWAVIDGHGGGCVATYASEVLLPHIAASISRALDCEIVDRGVCTVNGQLRDANALDLDGLIKTSDRSMGNPYSIHYRSPHERSDSEDEECGEGDDVNAVPGQTARERKQIASLVNDQPSMVAEAGSMVQSESGPDASVSSVKTSVKTAASPGANQEALLGTHSPREVAAITRAITESFLAVDEGWINSIDPVATHQTSCQSNGRWNSGACALVVFTIQRLDWTSVSEPDREKESRGPEKSRRNTSQNRDAARRRMLDYAARAKSASSMSTVSSTSSLTTEEAVNASGPESEITETEGEDDRLNVTDVRKRNPYRASTRASQFHEESLISPPGGSSSNCYRAHDAMLYTAHVGDCRAVMLGSAPPRTIKVRGRDTNTHPDTTDDESSHHSSDETECLSSSDHDADSSEDEDLEITEGSTAANATTSSYMNFPRRVVRQRSCRRATDDFSGPFTPLPPIESKDENAGKRFEFDFDTDTAGRELRRLNAAIKDPSDSSTSSQDSEDLLPLVHLAPVTRPIDLTTDHSAYNPAEVTAVLRRCNNAPRAISAGVGGGIKRVAGSLAVTRALGDAYLKTPLLSFLPYKSHAPYITGRPEVNCRPLVKEHDKVLILATDGIWERASGEDVLRWVRNFYEERVAEAERRSNRRLNQFEKSTDKDKGSSNEEPDTMGNNSQEAAERDLFERNDGNERHNGNDNTAGRKREIETGSPSPPAKRRKRGRQNRILYNVADVIVRRVLNKVRRARNISSLQALMSLPQGRARRSKHDDITSSVVDLSAFIS